jgi:hypothetical protein
MFMRMPPLLWGLTEQIDWQRSKNKEVDMLIEQVSTLEDSRVDILL